MDWRKNLTDLEHALLRETAFDYLAEIGGVKPQIEGTPVTRHSTIEPDADVTYQEYSRFGHRSCSKAGSLFVDRFNHHNLTVQLLSTGSDYKNDF